MKNGCVIVTGASSGIGYACALDLAKNGYNVVCTYNNNEDGANKLKNEIENETNSKCVIIKCDVRNEEDIRRVVSKAEFEFEKIIGLVNNAGISLVKLFLETNAVDDQNVFDVNYKGTFLFSKYVGKHMVNVGTGSIVNISSMWGEIGGSMESSYSASKSAVIGLTKALSKELGLSGIRVNCICPGLIDTEMNSHLKKEEIDELIEKTPLSRIGKTSDVANLCTFLISDKSSFITGDVIMCDGGISTL